MAKTDFFEFTKGPKLKKPIKKKHLDIYTKSYISLWFSRFKVSFIAKINYIKAGFQKEKLKFF